MTNIYLSKYIYNLSAIRMLTKTNLEPYPNVQMDENKYKDNSYVISWGDSINKSKNGVMETGFFWDAVHIDSIGLYSSCSLNTPHAAKMIRDFNAPVEARKIIMEGNLPTSKYRQIKEKIKWDGVVLALQNPTDRSIHRGSSTKDYYNFVEGACKFYGKNLFLKLHPWNKNEVEAKFREFATKYKCSIGRVNHTVLTNCKFVIVYNSTFIVDCLIRGVKVAQYAPGYFWQTEPVLYTSYNFPDEISTDINKGYKFCDFLVWKYLIYQGMKIDMWIKLFNCFADSKEVFPITEDLCYALNVMDL